MSSKTVAAALLLAFVAPVFAQADPTFADIASANRELKYQELRNKISEAKAKASPASAATSNLAPQQPPAPLPGPLVMPASRNPVPEPIAEPSASSKMQVVAIYGIGHKLSAEIQYNGSTHTVRTGVASSVGDWTVEAITPYNVVLSKPGVKTKKGESTPGVRQTLHLASEPATDPNAGSSGNSRRQGTGGPDFSSMTSPFSGGSMPRMPVPQLPAFPPAR